MYQPQPLTTRHTAGGHISFALAVTIHSQAVAVAIILSRSTCYNKPAVATHGYTANYLPERQPVGFLFYRTQSKQNTFTVPTLP